MKQETFKDKVLKIVAEIPEGYVLTYGEVAKRSGNSRAARAVGAMMRANHNPKIPCHRVIASDGTAGGYNKGVAQKIRLLKAEGIKIPYEK